MKCFSWLFAGLTVFCSLQPVDALSYSPTLTHAPQIINASLDLQDWPQHNNAVIPLDGEWFFVPNQLITPTEWSSFGKNAGKMDVPGSWPAQTDSGRPFPFDYFPNDHGYATYALTIKPPTSSEPAYAQFNQVCASARIYFFPDATPQNATMTAIGHPATNGMQTIPAVSGARVPLRFSGLGTHTLLVQVANFSTRAGGLCAPITLGTQDQLELRTLTSTSLYIFVAAALLVIGLYALAVYTQQSGTEDQLWMTILCTSIATLFLVSSGLLERSINVDQRWFYELHSTLVMLSLHWICAAAIMTHGYRFADFIKPNWLALNVLIAATSSIFIILSPTWLKSALLPVYLGYWGIQLIGMLYILVNAARLHRSHSRLILGCLAPAFALAPLDIRHLITTMGGQLHGAFVLLPVALVECYLLTRRFTQATRLSERLSTHFREEVSLQTAELHRQNRQLETTQIALQAANDELKKLSVIDGLTDIYNRMYFEQELRKEWRRARRSNSPVSILMIDVDHFKSINDTAGHVVGDQCLQALAQELKSQVKRAGEVVARYGGEEFVILLPETNQRKGLAVAEALRQRVETMEFSYAGITHRITVSIGVSTTVPSDQFSPEQLLNAADKALYEAKKHGRNRIASNPLLQQSPPSSNDLTRQPQTQSQTDEPLKSPSTTR